MNLTADRSSVKITFAIKLYYNAGGIMPPSVEKKMLSLFHANIFSLLQTDYSLYTEVPPAVSISIPSRTTSQSRLAPVSVPFLCASLHISAIAATPASVVTKFIHTPLHPVMSLLRNVFTQQVYVAHHHNLKT